MRRIVKLVTAVVVCSLIGLGLAATASASPGKAHHLSHPKKTFTVHGTSSGTYRVSLWKHSTVRDCFGHAHGPDVRHYFKHDPCRSMTRWLYTTTLDGRQAVFEIEAVSVGSLPGDDNGTVSAGRLVRALHAGHRNGLQDLLLGGYRIPPAGNRIPSEHVHNVFHEDGGVAVFDAWWANGHTAKHNHQLEKLEHQLYLSRAMS